MQFTVLPLAPVTSTSIGRSKGPKKYQQDQIEYDPPGQLAQKIEAAWSRLRHGVGVDMEAVVIWLAPTVCSRQDEG